MSRSLPLASPQTQVDFTVQQLGSGGAVLGGGATDGSMSVTGGNGTSAASSSNPVPVAGATFNFLSHQQLTLTTGSLALPTIPATATTAIVQNNGTQGGRFRYDGATTAPTASTGQRVAANGVVTMDVGQATLLTTRVIADTGGVGGVLDIVYGRYGA